MSEVTVPAEEKDWLYDSVEVAMYICAYWNENGSEINMTKLQKLLYIAYGI